MKKTPRPAQVERFLAGWREMGADVAAHYRAQGLAAEMARAAALGAMTQALLRRFAVEEETARTGMPPLGPRLGERLELFLDGFAYAQGVQGRPAEKAVRGAITPEVAGEACEALCAAADFADHRQGAGIFYTEPQEIDLMCRLALGQYLAEEFPEVAPSLWYQALLARATAAAGPDAALARAGLWPAVVERLGRLTVLDPACGSGSFLVGMLRVLAELLDRADRALGRPLPPPEEGRGEAGTSLLCGVDVMPWAVAVTRLRTEALLGEARWKGAKPGLALRAGDALLLDWERTFPTLWGEAATARGCDVVIGNPPYVRQEAIGDPARPGGDREDGVATRSAWPR